MADIIKIFFTEESAQGMAEYSLGTGGIGFN